MVITDNSPSAGKVAWTGMIINYKSSDYNITDGNSDKKYLWWDFTSPTVLQETDSLPTMTDDDQIVLLNLSGIHYLIPTRTKVQAALLTGTMNEFISTPSSAPSSDYHVMNKKFFDDRVVAGWIAAGETWTFASDDDPTYTFTIASFDATSKYSVGMKVKLTDSGTQYGIITKVVFDNPGSTITIFMGTDYDLSGGVITNPYYSLVKAPLDFPLDPDKWSVIVTDTTERSQASPVSGTWYNLGTTLITIPIGIWNVSYQVGLWQESNDSGCDVYVTLSTANNSESDKEFTAYKYLYAVDARVEPNTIAGTVARQKILELATKDIYYLNTKKGSVNASANGNIKNTNDVTTLIIKAVCAYL